MGKKLRYMIAAAVIALFATDALAQDAETVAGVQEPEAAAEATDVADEAVAIADVEETEAVVDADETTEASEKVAKEERVSADGSYKFIPSWGVGLQYGMTFTDMSNWNDYLLKPSRQSYFDVNLVSAHSVVTNRSTRRILASITAMPVSNPHLAFVVRSTNSPSVSVWAMVERGSTAKSTITMVTHS